MVDRNKILSDLSKFAVDAMSTFSGVKEEIETVSYTHLRAHETR